MSTKKNLKEKISPVTQTENIDGEFFTNEEWKYFKDEINKQVAEGEKIIDFGKAGRNARYLAKLDKSIRQDKEGKLVKFTDEEWEKFVDGQELY